MLGTDDRALSLAGMITVRGGRRGASREAHSIKTQAAALGLQAAPVQSRAGERVGENKRQNLPTPVTGHGFTSGTSVPQFPSIRIKDNFGAHVSDSSWDS